MADQPLPLGSAGHWNHIGACWITLCGFLCSGELFGAGSGGRTSTTRNGLGRWSLLYQMELPIMVGQPLHLVWRPLEPCWCSNSTTV
jgi:hypothetical protein